MDLRIHSKNDVPISPTIEEYATKRIGKMDRYLSDIDSGTIEISEEGPKQADQRFVVQVTLVANSVTIRAQERAEDVRTAIDRVTDALTNRILRYKGRRVEKGTETLRTMEPALSGVESQETDETPRIVKTKQFQVKPMPIDEAAEQMELLGHDFFLFVNAESEQANVLYRRKDGNYGLIEPSL